MNDGGKSDKPIVPKKGSNNGVAGNHAWRRAWREGAWPREIRNGTPGFGHSAKQTCNKGRTGSATPDMRQYPRREPGAVMPHAGICAGGGLQGPSLPRPSCQIIGPSPARLVWLVLGD